MKFTVTFSSAELSSAGDRLQCSCLENPTDGGAWWAAVHGVAESQTRLSGFTLTFHFPALEKELATHSSVLAWRIPGTAEPGGLPSVGSQKSRTRLTRLSSSRSVYKQRSGQGDEKDACLAMHAFTVECEVIPLQSELCGALL